MNPSEKPPEYDPDSFLDDDVLNPINPAYEPWVDDLNYEEDPDGQLLDASPLSNEDRLLKLSDITANLLEREDREYLDDLDEDVNVNKVGEYVTGRLQDLGYDVAAVFEKFGLVEQNGETE